MFTGILSDKGKVQVIFKKNDGIVLEIQTVLVDEIRAGQSILINGVRLLVYNSSGKSINMLLPNSIASKTNLKNLYVGSFVNIELALRLSDRLSGTIIYGKIRGIVRVIEVTKFGINFNVWYEVPSELMRYLIKDGNIALNGISHIIDDLHTNHIMVSFTPFIWNQTIAHSQTVGNEVNLEIDPNALLVTSYLDRYFTSHLK